MAGDVPWEQLFEAAAAARDRAWAPYSHFPVGAAILTSDGSIFHGCNVENSSYGLTICAERSAIARAVSDGQREIRAVAIVVDTPEPTPACGMCRQTIAEFAPPETPVRSRNLQGRELRSTVAELLPHAFSKAWLGKG